MKQLSILDYTNDMGRAVRSNVWNKRQKRAYGVLNSVVHYNMLARKQLFFMTLTSSNEAEVLNQREHFKALVKRIRRICIHSHFCSRFKKNCRKGCVDFKFCLFEYFKLRTFEGKNHCVLHILFKGLYLDADFIREAWKEIHSSIQLKLIKCFGNKKKLVNYLVGYFCHHEFFRSSSSNNIIFFGWRTIWKKNLQRFVDFNNFNIKDLRKALYNWYLILCGKTIFYRKIFDDQLLLDMFK